ncbi:DUF4139 domain-containing protein [Streptomyces sp. NBC_01013]|uniref:DUF4139 domain-containing protein n=1 Tax=Streptomyces sp. NBC_01013 TaxID=2903718 RepID=UPI0038702669|nr:DUF4139 domain-containing protein [Streptomyces sp. NBC_01013]
MTAESAQRWESTLDSVVVYAQGALCCRLARGVVPSGGRVRVTGLPRSLDPGSLRVRVAGAPGMRVTEARVEVEAELPGTDTPDTLRSAYERLSDAYAEARERRDRQISVIEEVRALRPVPPARKREDPHRRTPADAWLALADFVDERLAGLHSRLVELEEALSAADHDLMVATDRLERESTDGPSAHVETTVCAVLTLAGTVHTGDEVEVEVEYGVPGAVWVPGYRLTHRQGDGSGHLVLRASVAQRTGEDWSGVRIALATADLRRRTDVPKLRSVRIGRSQPAPAPSGWREPPAGLVDLFSGYDSAGPGPDWASGPVSARAVGGGPVDAAAGSAPPPVPSPPPPPAPQGYGGPPPPGSAPPPAFGGAVPAPGQPAASRPHARTRSGGDPFMDAPAAMAPPAPGMAAPSPPPVPVAGPPQPSGAELDYAALELCGPDEQGGRRGRLFPGSPFDPVGAEYRRRAEAVALLPLPGLAVRPRESAGSFDHRFDATARADIPSDGTWHTVTVGEIPVGLRTEYLCVPSVEQVVYGTLVLSNATDQALLAGPVEVTVDDDFLLTTALPTLAPGGVRRVGLGPAEGVRVTHRTHVHESTSGLRNNTTVLDHRVHVELANRLARTVTVEVQERVPVTSEPDVRIEERADWTAPGHGAGPDRHAPGTRVWRLDLPAGATAALDGGYEIRIPTGKALVGGNRRS